MRDHATSLFHHRQARLGLLCSAHFERRICKYICSYARHEFSSAMFAPLSPRTISHARAHQTRK